MGVDALSPAEFPDARIRHHCQNDALLRHFVQQPEQRFVARFRQALAACEACNASGSRGHAAAQTCPTCHGAGKVRAQQGFFVVERHCPHCGGAGETISDPCRNCEGEGRAFKCVNRRFFDWPDSGRDAVRAFDLRTRCAE